jgi:hypothetical protein
MNDPAKDLGTFRTHSERSSMRGEQEKPWRLSIPEEDERRNAREVQNNRLPRLDSDETYSPSKYPLPDSDIMSPINPAAVQVPPPPPPKIPLSQDSLSPPPSSHRRSGSLTANAVKDVPTNSHSPGPPVPLKDDWKLETALKGQEKHRSPVELDARPTKDTESEEIVMSSTAYPGQEWQPENWGHWDVD